MIIGNQTRLIGIIGDKLEHSLSPLMQNQMIQELGLDYAYVPLCVAANQLENAVGGLRALNFIGANVTVPYKESVIPFMDKLDRSAEECGAVNVICNRDGTMIGYNTDGAGFSLSLEEINEDSPSSAIIIGCGGASRSLALALADMGLSQLTCLDISTDRAERLADYIRHQRTINCTVNPIDESQPVVLTGPADIIVNCTPVGMHPNVFQSPVAGFQDFGPNCLAYDLIYNPYETSFLKMARLQGMKTMNGIAMLAYQGALSLEIWTGMSVPRLRMRTILEEHISV